MNSSAASFLAFGKIMNNSASVMAADSRQECETINLGKLLGLADQIQTICLARKTGEIRITNVVPSGRINIVEGEVVHAQFGGRSGLDAAIALINLRNPESEIVLGQGTSDHTIHLNFVHILLEAACRKDETVTDAPTAGQTAQVAYYPTLRVIFGAKATDHFLVAGLTLIGRLSSNDIVIPSSNVSRRHAGIKIGPSGIIVRDLGSTNGTFLDGQRVTEAPLFGEARLRFGTVEALFSGPEEQ